MHAGQVAMVERLRASEDAFLDAVADELERMARMVRHASDQGVTFPPDTLPRVAGSAVVVVDPSDGSETLVVHPQIHPQT